jgi:hypothetical protein
MIGQGRAFLHNDAGTGGCNKQVLASPAGKKYYSLSYSLPQASGLAPDSRSGASFFGLARSPGRLGSSAFRALSIPLGDGKNGMASSNLSKTGRL